MKRKSHLVIIALGCAVFAFAGCAHHREVTEEREVAAEREVAPTKAYLFKSKNQRELTEREALAGDNAAAKRMADYYYFARNDRGNAMWWLKLAASRGDAEAKANLKKLQQE